MKFFGVFLIVGLSVNANAVPTGVDLLDGVPVVAPLGAISDASTPVVNVTSFRSVRGVPRLGEICGRVTPAGSTRIQVIADPRSSDPGYYTAHSASNGKFCKLVHTYHGEASATIDASPIVTLVSIQTKKRGKR